MTGSRLGWFGAGAAIFLIAAPALGQTSLDDPLDARDARRVARMEKVVRELRDIVFKAQRTGAPVVVQPADTDSRMADQAVKIDDLQLSLTRINGSLEAATHDVDQARRVIVALQAQAKILTDRISAVEQKLAEAQTPPPPPPPSELAIDAPKAGAADAFAKARQLMLSGDYDAAETAFGAFGADYPDDPKAPEANYWWGKTLAVRGDTTKAAGALIASIRGWPQTPWAPDAVVELSRALIALKKPADACQTLAELGRRYPKAPPAVTGKAAAARLQAKCATT